MSKKPNLYTDVAKFYDYDATEKMNSDIAFYLDYAKKIGAKKVLDLCCGTGRVSLKLANEFEVTAIDFSNAMLEVFKAKLAKLPELKRNITIINQNATDFKLSEQYDLIIIPYRSFQQFAGKNDALNCLRCVREHLSAKGKFILSCYRPQRVLDENWTYPKKIQWQIENREEGSVITKFHWGEKIDLVNQLIYPVLCYEVVSASGKEVFYEDLTLKYYYHEQLIQMLHQSNFFIEEEFGDYEGGSVETGTEYIFVCSNNKSGGIQEETKYEVL